MGAKQFFRERYFDILRLANTDAGRFLIGCNSKEHIAKITPNSFHTVIGRTEKTITYNARFFCYEKMAKIFIPIITKMDIYEYEYRNQINERDALLHYSGLQPSIHLPQIYLTQQNYYAGAGD